MYRNRFRSVPMTPLLIMLSFVVAGCYTMMKHPQIKQEESHTGADVQPARSCTDCHAEIHADIYYHDPYYRYDPFWVRRPFYARPYYRRWHHYRSYPWWWDRYEHRRHDYRDDRYYPKTDKKDELREGKRDWGWRRSRGGVGPSLKQENTVPKPTSRSNVVSDQDSPQLRKKSEEDSKGSKETKQQSEEDKKKEDEKKKEEKKRDWGWRRKRGE